MCGKYNTSGSADTGNWLDYGDGVLRQQIT